MAAGWEEMTAAVKMAFEGNWYLLFFFVGLVYLLIAEKKWRNFTIPVLILSALILNPFLYRKLWVPVLTYAYWRTFWMIPIVPVMAAAAVSIAGKCRKKSLKGAVCVCTAVICLLGGHRVYDSDTNRFFPITNAYKLPQGVIDVSDYLLAQEAHPRALVDSRLMCYIHQYTMDIDLMYGREAYGQYILAVGADQSAVFQQMESGNPDFQMIRQMMQNYSYTYLVIDRAKIPEGVQITDSGFRFLADVNDYSIYKVVQE